MATTDTATAIGNQHHRDTDTRALGYHKLSRAVAETAAYDG